MRLYYTDFLTLMAALAGRFAAASRLAAYADVRNARAGKRQRNEATAHALAVEMARAALEAMTPSTGSTRKELGFAISTSKNLRFDVAPAFPDKAHTQCSAGCSG